eukprot:CAMPEP_0118957354 /NCGR_PEP_ID=MMETSP1169-20130426/62059_1 /TAXON_ID=36882 /ORGANISM="Pyramimonas obovata, Strain CCMP722" /LENGTH=150 /DNA_ID=CAMNT_0006905429 /DNA_START=722 /DNA_END=1174 /DNA_ORIENTATION=+
MMHDFSSSCGLNPQAAAFVPGSPPQGGHDPSARLPDADAFENACFNNYFEPDKVEQAELRAVDEWVETMANLEELEVNHLINVALAHADPARVHAIESQAGRQNFPGTRYYYTQVPPSARCTVHKSCMAQGGKCLHTMPRHRHVPARPRR